METPQSLSYWLTLLSVTFLCLIKGSWVEAEGSWRSLCPLCAECVSLGGGKTSGTAATPTPGPLPLTDVIMHVLASPTGSAAFPPFWNNRGAGSEQSNAT